MNRRSFILSTAALSLVGCSKQQQMTLAQEANIIGTTAAAIATQLGNTQLATDLQTATTTAVNLITNWQPGTPTVQIEQSLNALLTVIDKIPAVAPYATLITILVAGVEGAIALLPSSSAPAVIKPAVTHSFVPSAPITDEKEFRRQYNAEIVKHPELALRPI
jgi:hypothetical protein